MKQIVKDQFRDLMGTASTRPNSFNQRYKQPFQSRGLRSRLETLFVIIVERKDTLIIIVVRGLTLEFLAVLVIDRVIFSLKVKEVLVGNLISRKTKTRPCLVAK